MSRWLRATALAAATIAGGALAAHAADLNYRDYGNRQGSAYDDPRYADLYGDAPPPRPHEPRYVEPYRPQYGYATPPIPREPVYRDHDPRDDYRQYSEAEPRYRAYSSGPGCLQRDEVRFSLERSGWRDFRDPRVLDKGTAMLTARRAGRDYQLKVDRCSGDILTARPLVPNRPYADYGYRPYRAY